MVANDHRASDFIQDFARGELGASLIRQRQDKGELVSPQASHRVHFTKEGPQSFGNLLEDSVAGMMPQPIVDLLETVQVHQQQRDGRGLTLRPRDRVLQPILKEQAIG
jgi:hypothetical protein